MHSTATPLPFTDRLLLALSDLAGVFVERDGFYSDSDLIDLADEHTVDAPYGDDEDGSRERPDHDALLNALDAQAVDYLVNVAHVATVDQ